MNTFMQFVRWAMVIVFLTLVGTCCAVTPTPAQKSIGTLIERMHSYKVDSFEFAKFDGKFDKKRQCKLMEMFFERTLLISDDPKDICNNFERYPSADSILLGNWRNSSFPVLIGTPTVNGNTAAVEVISDLRKFDPVGGVGRVVYFLRQTGEVWRIENAVYFDHWPLKPDDICKSEFIVPPTREQKKYEVTNCRP